MPKNRPLCVQNGAAQRQLLSILKGQFISPTRNKLRELERNVTELGGNLRGLYDVFDHFQARSIKGKATVFYTASKNWWGHWENNRRNVDILRRKVLAKLSISPAGAFYDDLKGGNPQRVGENAAALKTDVDALLLIIRNFKK